MGNPIDETVALDAFDPNEVVTTEINCPVCPWQAMFVVCYEDTIGVAAALAKAHALSDHPDEADQMRLGLPMIDEPEPQEHIH